jgi:hypothetical protein
LSVAEVSAIVKTDEGIAMKPKPKVPSAPKRAQTIKSADLAVPVPPELLESAKRAVSADRIKKAAKCSVCNAETISAGDEPLCWVCRRLKISAWREIEQQIPIQE